MASSDCRIPFLISSSRVVDVLLKQKLCKNYFNYTICLFPPLIAFECSEIQLLILTFVKSMYTFVDNLCTPKFENAYILCKNLRNWSTLTVA